MIKFFRRARMQTLSKSEFGQCLIYAIGEIVLVVIGILIALQINNLNDEHKKKAKREELLIAMTKDLSQDIASHNRMIGFYQNRLDFFKRNLQKTDFSATHIDTLFLIFDANAGAHSVSDASFQKARNLGIAQLCTDDSLSLRIDAYYTQTAEVSKLLFDYDFEMTGKQNDFWMANQEKLEFDFKSSIKIPVIQDSVERTENALQLISSPRGRNNIKSECQIKELMLRYNKRTLQTAQTLLADIEAYLKEIDTD